jgi:hypothetical protein
MNDIVRLVPDAADDFEPSVETTPDGGALVKLLDRETFKQPDPVAPDDLEFGSNLADHVDVALLGQSLLQDVLSDHDSRADWLDAFKNGLKLMGINNKDDGSTDAPFEGASNVFMPLITDAVVQFQAMAYKELMPSDGPANAKIIGAVTPQVKAQAERVKDYLNYQCVGGGIPDFEEEYDRMLHYIGKSGDCFKKTYKDPITGIVESPYIRSEYVVVSYGAESLRKAPRVSHVMPMSKQEVDSRIKAGYYRDVATAENSLPAKIGDAQKALDDQQGVTKTDNFRSIFGNDKDRILVEVLVKLQFSEFPTDVPAPYRVTIDTGTGNVMSVYRAYREGDPTYEAVQNFSHYTLVQSDGFYGYGFIHLLGQLSRSSTALLRQLIDSGTLSTFQGGFKRQGTEMARSEDPLAPGEYRDITGSYSDNLQQDIMPLTFKEPSNVLFQLLGFLTDVARRMTSNTDLNVGQGNQEAPVGTTIALLERGMQVSSAIFKRLIRGQTAELKIMARIARDHTSEDGYPFSVQDRDVTVMREDFDDRVDVLPICDPENFSQAQRMAKAQFALQLAEKFPQAHDLRQALINIYTAAGIKEYSTLIPEPEQAQPLDPFTEVTNALKGIPLRVGITQHHDAHIQTHTAALQNPELGENQAAMQALQAHIQEHVAMRYQVQMMQKLGITPDQMEQAGQQLEQMAAQIAQAAQQVTGEAQAKAQAEQQAAQGSESIQIAQMNAQAMQAETQRKAKDDDNRFTIERAKLTTDQQKHLTKIQSDLQIAREKIAQQDRAAELNSTADAVKYMQAADKQEFDKFAKTVELVQGINEKEQQRDAKKNPKEG